MDDQQIANSQFADRCGIPRPTVSQILNGRNKKISDELIGKIHQAFPSLSVLWLMFGEGEMVVKRNIEISEPKDGEKLSFIDDQERKNETIEEPSDLFSPFIKISPENQTAHFQATFEEKETKSSEVFTQNETDRLSSSSAKQISSIVVFYADNTFETFHPSIIQGN